MRQTILVVGGLAAGPSAASKAKRTNPDAEVILFEQGEYVSSGICEVPYYVGGIITSFEDLNSLDPSKLERTRGFKVKVSHSVEQIWAAKKKLVVRDLGKDSVSEYSYDKLILAMGSKPRSLSVDGVEARNVFRVKSLVDGIAIKKFVDERKPKRCVIVGGGYVGMELCEVLVGLGINVVLLHLDDYPMTGLEDESRKVVLSELLQNGVDFKPREQVTRFVSDSEGAICSVTTESTSYKCDFVILSIGVEPNTSLASQARIGLGRHHGIQTDERQSTNVDSIFAAGDCCEVKNVITGKWMYIPLATYASRQGRVAGENAAGGRAVFKGAIRSIAVKIFGMEIAQVGISSLEARESGHDFLKTHVTSDSKVSYFPGNAKIDIIALTDRSSRRILGANVFGGPGSVLRADILALAIQHKLTVEELSQLDLIYSPPFSPLWDPVLILAHQIKSKLN